MKFIAARLGLRRYVAGNRLAHLGVILLQRHLGFGNSVEVRVDDDDTQDWILVVGAVQLIVGSAEVLAVNENLLRRLRIFGARVGPTRQLLRTGRQQLELREVAVQTSAGPARRCC